MGAGFKRLAGVCGCYILKGTSNNSFLLRTAAIGADVVVGPKPSSTVLEHRLRRFLASASSAAISLVLATKAIVRGILVFYTTVGQLFP